MESGFKCGSGEPGSSFCVMMDILYHVPHLCGGFFAIFNELNSKSKNGWPSASGKSFEEVIPANFPPGLYAYRNILGIPGSSKDPSMNFARIIKMTEAVIVIISGTIYYREASDGTWNEKWKKITATDVSVAQ